MRRDAQHERISPRLDPAATAENHSPGSELVDPRAQLWGHERRSLQLDQDVRHRYILSPPGAVSYRWKSPFPRGSRLDQPTPDRVARDLRDRAHPELAEDARAMMVDRLAADDEHVGDLVAAVSLRDQLDDLELARAQRVGRDGLTAARLAEILA